MLNQELTAAQRLERYYTAVTAETCRRSLRKFVRRVWPLIDPKPYVEAWHIDAICLPAETVIHTEIGQLQIGYIVESGWKGRVLSYNHATGLPEWRMLVAGSRSPFQPIYEIRNADSALQITGNHPVFVDGQGYTPAEKVKAADSVLCVHALSHRISTCSEQSGSVLQHEVLRCLQDQTGISDLPGVRRPEGLGREDLQGVQRQENAYGLISAVPPMSRTGLPHPRKASRQQSSTRRFLQQKVLQPLLRRLSKFGLYRRAVSSGLPAEFPQGALIDSPARQQPVLSVCLDGTTGDSPHRQGQTERQPREPRDTLSQVPCETARAQVRSYATEGIGIGRVLVTSVMRTLRVCDHLYNLTVEGNNNYFANGVLVHNCDHLAYVAIGDIQNLMINIGPRMTKSSVVSVAFPAWMWTDEENAALQFLCGSYAKDLAEGDALKMRRIVSSEWYQARYPHVMLLGDQNRADDFRNTLGGYRQSISVGGRTTGMGGDIQIGDDFHNAATIEHDAVRKAAVNWHDNAWRSRVNDPNKARRVYCGQRTHDGDIYGHVLGREEKRWVHLNLPMEFDESRRCITYRNKGAGPIGEPIFRDPRTKPNALMCPARMDEEAAAAEKEAIPKRTWDAQYNQQPEGRGGVILKRKWWRKWQWPEWHPEFRKTDRPLPEIIQVLQAYDTAFEPDEQDSYTVRTTWGLFEHSDTLRLPNGQTRQLDPKINAILLERHKWRPSFGALVDDAVLAYQTFSPDRVLVEKKASGHSLVQELRAKGIPVRAVKIQGDLVYRAHMASLPLEKGSIWHLQRNWAIDLIEECAKFPNVDFNDQVASCVIAWMYMRRYMDLQIEDDEDTEELELFNPKTMQQRVGIYG